MHRKRAAFSENQEMMRLLHKSISSNYAVRQEASKKNKYVNASTRNFSGKVVEKW